MVVNIGKTFIIDRHPFEMAELSTETKHLISTLAIVSLIGNGHRGRVLDARPTGHLAENQVKTVKPLQFWFWH